MREQSPHTVSGHDAEYVQEDQPPGVPPLALTGERTLPDVPEENYWFRRHLAVYEWIADAGRRAAGRRHGLRRGLRLRRAGGAGARRAWSASTPTPRPTSTPGCATGAPTCASSATWSRASPSPATRSSSCRRSSTCEDPGAILEHFKSMLGAGRRRLRLDPEPADPGAARRREVRQPLAPARVPRRRSSASSARPTSREVELLGLFHARKLRAHELAIKLGWDSRPQGACGITKPLLRPLHPGDRGLGLRACGPSDLDRALDFLAVCHA